MVASDATKENTDSCFDHVAYKSKSTFIPSHYYVRVCVVPPVHSAKIYNAFMDIPKTHKHFSSSDN